MGGSDRWGSLEQDAWPSRGTLVIEPLSRRASDRALWVPAERGARQAIYDIRKWVTYGYDKVIDLDLKSYSTDSHHELLMKLVQRRVRDARVLG